MAGVAPRRPSKGDSSVSALIQAYIRRTAAIGRDTERIGPFLATFTAHDANPFVNYAVPEIDARPTPEEVAALVTAYERRNRIPRLEYLPRLAPAVEPALLAGGFTVEARPPLMTCRAGAGKPAPVPRGIELVEPVTDDELRGLLTAQEDAFDEAEPRSEANEPGTDKTEPRSEANEPRTNKAEPQSGANEPRTNKAEPGEAGTGEADEGIARLRRLIAAGMLAVYARDIATGEPAGGGVCTAISDGVGELAGIGVRARYRRRGLGAAITAYLTEAGFRAGATELFLTPGGEGAERIYERAGFRTTDEVLFVSRRVASS
jgi:ribosomal protein S18 acetylase RimI-like enzyme